MRARIIVINLIFLLIFPLTANATKNAQVVWNPERVEETIGLGESIEWSVGFVSNVNLKKQHLHVSPKLQPFVSLDKTNFYRIRSGEMYFVNLRINIPHGTKTGPYNGAIFLGKWKRHGGKRHKGKCKNKYHTALKIKLDIVDASTIIGSEGGMVKVTDISSPLHGVEVIIPEGAYDTRTKVSVSEGNLDISSTDGKIRFVKVGKPILIEAENNLNKSAIIRIPYVDEDDDGIEDMSGIPEDQIKVYYQLESNGPIFMAEKKIDYDLNQIEIITDHFSEWISGDQKWQSNSNILLWRKNFPTNHIYGNADFAADIWDIVTDYVSELGKQVPNIQIDWADNEDDADIIFDSENLCNVEHGLRYCKRTRGITDWDEDKMQMRITFNTSAQEDGFPRVWVANDYDTWPPEDIPENHEQAFRAVAAHEIGHALGLVHDGQRFFPSFHGPTMNGDWLPLPINIHEPQIDIYFYQLHPRDIYQLREKYEIPFEDLDSDFAPDDVDNCAPDDIDDCAPDDIDNCEGFSNTRQHDSNRDGIGDLCQEDSGIIGDTVDLFHYNNPQMDNNLWNRTTNPALWEQSVVSISDVEFDNEDSAPDKQIDLDENNITLTYTYPRRVSDYAYGFYLRSLDYGSPITNVEIIRNDFPSNNILNIDFTDDSIRWEIYDEESYINYGEKLIHVSGGTYNLVLSVQIATSPAN